MKVGSRRPAVVEVISAVDGQYSSPPKSRRFVQSGLTHSLDRSLLDVRFPIPLTEEPLSLRLRGRI